MARRRSRTRNPYTASQIAKQLSARLRHEGLGDDRAEDMAHAARQGADSLFVHLAAMDTDLRGVLREIEAEARHEERGFKPLAEIRIYKNALAHVRRAMHQTDALLRRSNPRRRPHAKTRRTGNPRPANPGDYMAVAETIKQQIGHRAFTMMGAKEFMGGDGGRGTLKFKLGRGARDHITHVMITLEPSDTYTVAFLRWHGGKRSEMETVAEYDDVYVENLRSLISKVTGFALRL